jgi:hypothetical protein
LSESFSQSDRGAGIHEGAKPKLAPLRSAIGMLEWWNNGTMGFGKMGHGFIGKIPLDMGVSNIKI